MAGSGEKTTKKRATDKSQRTRERIYKASIKLFRDKGFTDATMRDIAKASEMSLGAAYYHFKNKEDLAMEFYRQHHRRLVKKCEALFADTDDLRERIVGVGHAQIDLLKPDHKLVQALVKIVADPQSPAAVFSKESAPLREASLTFLTRTIAIDGVPDQVRRLLALALWTFQMSTLMYFVWDDSKGFKRTHRLIENGVDLILPLVPLAHTPMAELVFEHLELTLEQAAIPVEFGAGE